MPQRTILFSGGKVTSHDPTLLADDELVDAADAEYRPDDPALWKIRGRTKFNATPEAGSIRGIVFGSTTVAGEEIFVSVGTTIRKAAAGLTGAFSALFSGLVGSDTFDAVHVDRHIFFFNGVDRGRVYGPDFPTGGLQGMLANVAAPTLSQSGAGLTLSAGNTIRYWVEERVKVDSAVVKRSAASTTTFATLTGPVTDDSIVITRPAVVNTDATHWAAFASATNGAFPNGAEVGEAAIATTTITDSRAITNPGLPTGAIYQTQNVVFQGLEENLARNALPPIASTADVLHDSIVCNDTAKAEEVRWSFPGNPHAFPATNVVRPGWGKRKAIVRLIRRIQNMIVIITDTRAYRLTTLPQETDIAFQPERVLAEIDESYGCVGEMAGDVFLLDNRQYLAYVSPVGVIATDGHTWDIISEDADWGALTEPSQFSKFILRNDPRNFRLVLWYVPLGGTTASKQLFLHYHPSHLKQTPHGIRPKLTFPITGGATAVTHALIAGQYRLFAGRSDGTVYVESNGTSDAGGESFAFSAETAEKYLFGLGETADLREVWLHHTAAPGQTATVVFTVLNEGVDPRDAQPLNLALDRREPGRLCPREWGEAHSLRLTNTDSLGPFALNHVTLSYESEGVPA